MRCCRTRLTDALQQRIRLLPTRLIGPGGNDDSVEGTFTAIAVSLGRTVSTVSREVKANGGRDTYRAHVAHQRAFEQSRRPKTPKLACERLAAKVAEWLEEWWSPEEISARLRMEFPDDPMMWVSHETIYMSLFVEGRGQLRRELSRCLRTGRAQRRPRSRIETRGKIPGMVMISERPAEAEDRAVPGHWEGDLIIGEGQLGCRNPGRAHQPLCHAPPPPQRAPGREGQ